MTRDQFLSRRRLLQGAAAGGLALGAGGILAGCGGDDDDAADDTTSAATTSTATGDEINRGGRLRVGFGGGGAGETMDPGLGVATIDAARISTLFDRLVRMEPDFSLGMELAESFEPNADATKWTIALRQGVTWHDGKDFTADDVIYTWTRAATTKGHAAASSVAPFDLENLKKIDAHTIELPLKIPIASLPNSFVLFPMSIVQDGAKDFTKPIGTGAFKHSEFTAGTSSLMLKHDGYWKEGQPYLDELEFQSIPDAAARMNALLGGTIDANEEIGYANAKQYRDGNEIQVLVGEGPNMRPFLTAVDQAPFNDPLVRQALRLVVDRQAIVDGAQLGFGDIGNDIYGKGHLFYHDELPQRERDVEKAKSLLKQAGKENLEVTFTATDSLPGMLESATIFAEQAKEAGITIKVDKTPADTFWTDKYLKVAFSHTNWNPVPIPNWHEQAVITDAIWNETHWRRKDFDAMVRGAQGTIDEAAAKTQWWDIQEILYNEGGYIIWGFFPYLDGLAPKVRGAVGNGFFNLSNYNFRDYWLAS